MKLLFILSLALTFSAQAQNLSTYEKSFPSAPDSDEFHDFANLIAFPIELGVGIGTIPALRNYLNRKTLNAWEQVSPNEVQKYRSATEQQKIAQKSYDEVSSAYENLKTEYSHAENGYSYQEARTGLRMNMRGQIVMQTYYETVDVPPNPAEAEKILPELKKAEAHVAPETERLALANRELDAADGVLKAAEIDILTGSRAATEEARVMRKTLSRYRIFKVAGLAGSIFIMADAIARVYVVADGRRPGMLPAIPMGSMAAEKIKNFISPLNKPTDRSK